MDEYDHENTCSYGSGAASDQFTEICKAAFEHNGWQGLYDVCAEDVRQASAMYNDRYDYEDHLKAVADWINEHWGVAVKYSRN